MSLWRSPAGPGARPTRRGPRRPELLRLDDRIVPDVTVAGTTATAVTPTTSDSSLTSTTTTTTAPDTTTTSTSTPTTTESTSTSTPATTDTTSTTTPASTEATSTTTETTSTSTPATTETTSTSTPTTTSTSTPSTTTNTTATSTAVGDTTTTTSTSTTSTDTPDDAPLHIYSVGSDVGNGAQVMVYDTAGDKKFDFVAYAKDGYLGGVRVATGDMNGDDVEDIITAPGPGLKSIIQVYDGVSGQMMLNFNAYDPSFRGGAYVAVGDVNGDGRNDLVVGAGDSGGSHVKVFDGKGLFPAQDAVFVEPGPTTNLIREFFAYDPIYNVGARVAVADVDGDGKAEVITGAGQPGGPHVRIFSGADGTVYREFFAYDPLFRGGVFVTGGDLNDDGKAEVITGMGVNGNGRLTVYDGGNGRQLRSFIPDTMNSRSSTRVNVFDFDHDGDPDIVTGIRNQLASFDGKTYVRTGGMTPFDPRYTGGVFFG